MVCQLVAEYIFYHSNQWLLGATGHQLETRSGEWGFSDWVHLATSSSYSLTDLGIQIFPLKTVVLIWVWISRWIYIASLPPSHVCFLMGCCLCFSPPPPHRPLTVQSVRTSSSSSGSGVAACRRPDSPSTDRTTCSSALCLFFFYYSVTHFKTPALPHLFFLIFSFHKFKHFTGNQLFYCPQNFIIFLL